MGMVVRSNIMAVNANRQLGINNSQVSKSLEKLASGFKINRAGDDASGLAISEKMKAQIKGLDTASANSQDGISLIQTAEGALTEVHDMLGRMVELAGKAANGTMDQNVDRASIQKEVDALKAEIDRVAESTNFNGIKLLDGSLDSSVQGTGTGNGQKSALVQSSSGNVTYANAAAVKDKFVATNAVGAVAVAATDIKATISYRDSDGSVKSMEVTVGAVGVGNAAATGTALVAGLNANADFSSLFTASDNATADGKVNVESKASGANAPQILDIAYAKADTGTGTFTTVTSAGRDAASVAGKDASGEITLAAAATAKDTVTVGEKTYEFVANAGDAVAEGNIAVLIGASATASATNLTAALKTNGVSSASNAAGVITIADKSQIATEQKGVGISTNSQGVLVNNTAATKGVYKQTIDVASAGTDKQTFTVKYMLDGKEQTAQVEYTASTNADTNRAAVVAALKDNDSLKGLFDITDDGTDEIVFTAKTAGSEGAVVTSTSTSDTAAGMVAGLTTTAAKDAGKTLAFENNDIKNGDTFTVGGKTYEFVSDLNKKPVGEGNIGIVKGANSADTLKNVANLLKADGIEFSSDGTKISIKDEAVQPSKGLTLQIGDTADSFNQVTVSVADMSTKGLKIDELDVSTREAASAAQKLLKDTETGGGAINSVSSTRADLGALQNRLEHTINNLDVSSENMNSANSRVRDTDMAKQMMEYTKQNVLTQAAQAMLAQANQQPQSVLQLLQ